MLLSAYSHNSCGNWKSYKACVDNNYTIVYSKSNYLAIFCTVLPERVYRGDRNVNPNVIYGVHCAWTPFVNTVSWQICSVEVLLFFEIYVYLPGYCFYRLWLSRIIEQFAFLMCQEIRKRSKLPAHWFLKFRDGFVPISKYNKCVHMCCYGYLFVLFFYSFFAFGLLKIFSAIFHFLNFFREKQKEYNEIRFKHFAKQTPENDW